MRPAKIVFSYALIIYLALSFCIVFYDLYNSFAISSSLKENFWQNSAKVVAIISPDRVGERQQAEMVKIAAERLGYQVYIYGYNDIYAILLFPAKLLHNIFIKVINFVIKPEIHLAISAHVNINLPSPKIMYIGVSPDYYIKKFKDSTQLVREYDSLIDINMLSNDVDWLSPLLEKTNHRESGIIGIPANDFKNSKRDKLLLFGSLWGRKTQQLVAALTNLSTKEYMYFMEDKDLVLGTNQQFVLRNKNFPELISQLNYHGIGLCLHTPYHIKAKIPGSRIFEIISSGALAISDKNPFIEKYFGNNVLYFDQNASAEEIFKTIDRHVRWAQNNPKEAEKKAEAAHKILQEKFITEFFVAKILAQADGLLH